MRRLSIATFGLLVAGACTPQKPLTTAAAIPRPSPDDLVPQGIAYLCDGRKEVAVVYAKNRASVTFGEKTWRTEYQGLSGDGFRYADATIEWTGQDNLVTLRERGSQRPLAFNCQPNRRTTS